MQGVFFLRGRHSRFPRLSRLKDAGQRRRKVPSFSVIGLARQMEINCCFIIFQKDFYCSPTTSESCTSCERGSVWNESDP